MQICPPAACSEHSGLGSEVDGGDLPLSVSPDSVSSVSVRPGRGGAMSLTESSQRELQPNGSLCEQHTHLRGFNQPARHSFMMLIITHTHTHTVFHVGRDDVHGRNQKLNGGCSVCRQQSWILGV